MRNIGPGLLISVLLTSFGAEHLVAQAVASGPSDARAQKTYHQALSYEASRNTAVALDYFKKADKQDGGHCVACKDQIIECAEELGQWKDAEEAAQQMISDARKPEAAALAHFHLGALLAREAMHNKKQEVFSHAHDEMTEALAAFANFPDALFADGVILARLHHDAAAKAEFEQFVKLRPEESVGRQRALRFIADPELARARMVPPFAVTTLDGKRVSMDDLKGKVVLIDFWATWCRPCLQELPHVRDIANKFRGQPLFILSVSLDYDEKKWKDFVTKNEMTWSQYRDGAFHGPVAKTFEVESIPDMFTVDSDGVLQDQHMDAAVEGKLKKLLMKASDLQASQVQASGVKANEKPLQ